MSNTRDITLSASEIAQRWGVHPSTVLRTMRRFGYSGLKFGRSKQAARRFLLTKVQELEKLAGSQGNAQQGSVIRPENRRGTEVGC